MDQQRETVVNNAPSTNDNMEQMELDAVYANERILDDPWKDDDNITGDPAFDQENSEQLSNTANQIRSKMPIDASDSEEERYPSTAIEKAHVSYFLYILAKFNSFVICVFSIWTRA